MNKSFLAVSPTYKHSLPCAKREPNSSMICFCNSLCGPGEKLNSCPLIITGLFNNSLLEEYMSIKDSCSYKNSFKESSHSSES